MEIERTVDQHVIHPAIQGNFKSMPRKREHLSDSLDFVTFKLLSELKTDQSILPDSLMFLSLKKKFFIDESENPLNFGLMDEVLIQDSNTGRKKKRYILTDFVQLVLENLEEIEEYPK